jgi:septum formation protein
MTSPAILILASASPRRRELLTQAGYMFQVHAADIDETRRNGEDPAAYVQRLALEKAQAIQRRFSNARILGSDTTVVLHGEVLNKPKDRDEAARMLRALAGRKHEVHTGVAYLAGSLVRQHVETTSVFFTEISEADLEFYLTTGDSLDKAGAYGIQGYAARWIHRVEGDFFNVMGLPIAATVRLIDGR